MIGPMTGPAPGNGGKIMPEQHQRFAGDKIDTVFLGHGGSRLPGVRLNDFPVQSARVKLVTDKIKKQDGTDEYGDGQHGCGK